MMLNFPAISMAFILSIAAPAAASACYISRSGDPGSPNGAIVSMIYNPKFKNCTGKLKLSVGRLMIDYKPRHMKLIKLKDNVLQYTINEGFSGKDLAVITGIIRGKPIKVRFHVRHADTFAPADRWW